jgi:hypothetical protein
LTDRPTCKLISTSEVVEEEYSGPKKLDTR